jgi:hypothetical protein
MDDLEKKHDDELAALDKKYKEAIEGLDKDDAAVEGQFVTAVSEADGVITVSRAALKASDIPELAQSKITGLVDKIAEIEEAIENAEDGALQDAKDYTDAQLKAVKEALDADKVEAGQGEIIDSVKQDDGIVTVTKRALVAADIPVIAQSQVDGLEKSFTDMETAYKAADDTALAAAKKYTDDTKTALVAALNNTDAAVEKNFVTEVKQSDGVVTVKRAPVADIALTGSTDDLVQGTMTLVFNCGNSQVGTANEFANL